MSKSEAVKRVSWHFWECNHCTPPAEDTRKLILIAAFAEIHQCGYQAASINNILQRTGLTKGALYHYFPSKRALGLAVIDELICEQIKKRWIIPLREGNPITIIIEQLKNDSKEMTLADIRLGCPLNNLSQEMAPLDEEFRLRIESIYDHWRQGLKDALERGKAEGFIKSETNPKNIATVIIATLEGCLGLAKTGQKKQLLINCGEGLIEILESLRNNKSIGD